MTRPHAKYLITMDCRNQFFEQNIVSLSNFDLNIRQI